LEKQEIIRFLDENERQLEQLIRIKMEFWAEHVFLTPLWWFGFALTVIPWILFLRFRTKQNTDRLLYAGFFVMVVSLTLDVTGDQLGLWNYRFNVIPFLPTYAPWDLTLIPVTVMWLLQFKPRIHPLVKGAAFALLTAYVGEPFFNRIGIYEPARWEFTYSVPIYFFIYYIAHLLINGKTFAGLR